MNRSTFSLALAAFALALGLVSPCLAGHDTLRAMTPAGAGLYLEVDDLAEQWTRFRASELSERWQAFPPMARWQQTNIPALKLIAGQITGQLNLTNADLPKIFGGSALVAVWPERKGEGWEGTGLLLVESPDAELLKKLIAGFHDVSRRNGELKSLDEVPHAGVSYQIRRIRRGGADSSEFVAVVGNIGILTNREPLMRQVLDLRAAGSDPAGSLATAALLRSQAKTAPTSKALARLLIDPKVWGPMVEAGLRDAAAKDPDSAPAIKALGELYPSLQSWSVTAEVEADGLTFSSYLQLDRARVPAAWAAGISAFSGASRFLRLVPADAVIAVAGRMELAQVARLLIALVEPKDKAELIQFRAVAAAVLGGLDIWDDVLPAMGPDYGLYVGRDRQVTEGGLPLEAVFAIAIQETPAKGDDKPALATGLDGALKTLMSFAAVAHNVEKPGRVATVKSQVRDGISLTWMEGISGLTSGVSPSFSLSKGYLLLGTSREALLRAGTLSASDSLAEQSHWESHLPPSVRQPGQVLYVNLVSARKLVSEERPVLVAAIARVKSIEPAKVEKSLTQLDAILKLADHVVAVKQIDADGIAMALRVIARPAK